MRKLKNSCWVRKIFFLTFESSVLLQASYNGQIYSHIADGISV